MCEPKKTGYPPVFGLLFMVLLLLIDIIRGYDGGVYLVFLFFFAILFVFFWGLP